MTNMRQHIITDMSGHIAGELITAFRRHVTQLYLGGVSPAEGMAITAIVAKQFLIAAIGGAVILSGAKDPALIFDELVRAVFEDIALGRDQILSDIASVASAQAR